MSIEAGTVVGLYTIVSPLGKGGMGEVYRARHAKLDRDVALKILPQELAANSEYLRRFEQEARAASALNHPGIVTIYEVGHERSSAWIAMELVDGHDLRQVMARQRLSLKEALRIACKAADALAAAHDQGIVHRDLKPENLMVSSAGFVKILDFGLAKRIQPLGHGDATVPRTVPGALFGTFSYMSPEQASGLPLQAQSDQFSFGLIFFEMIAGTRPFACPTVAETLAAIIRQPTPPLSQFDANAPAELERILDRCLAKEPRERYASTRDLAHDLRSVRDALTHPSGSGRHLAPSPIRRPPVGRIAAISTAVGIFGLAVFLGRRTLETRAQAGQRIIAVLPFRDLTHTPDGEVFAHGLAETISTRLAQTSALRVVHPFDGAPVKDDEDPVAVARRRGADLLLAGTVQRLGDRLRITYKLMEAAEGKRIVDDILNAGTSEAFALQDSVASSVLGSLGLRATDTGRSPALLEPADQRAYVEAVGLLQRPRVEKSVDTAITLLEQVQANTRDWPPLNASLARAYAYKYVLTRRSAHLTEAVLYAERAVGLDPAMAEGHVSLGRVRNLQGRLAEAEAEFRKAMEQGPTLFEAKLGLAETLVARGRAADAKRRFSEALHLAPDSPLAINKYGEFAYTRGDYVEAARLFTRLAQVLPDSPRGLNNLGAVYQASGRYDEALASYQRALVIAPNAFAWSNLGTCQFFMQRYDQARKSFEEATRLTPANAAFWANLGDACRLTGDQAATLSAYTHAIALGSELLRLNPSDAPARARMASCLARVGKQDEAERESTTALKTNPSDPTVLYHAAIVAMARGDRDSTMDWLVKSIEAGRPSADIARDPDFMPLRNDPAFQNAIRPRPTKKEGAR